MALTGVKHTGADIAMSVGGTLLEQEVLKGVTRRRAKDVHDSTGAGGGSKTKLGGETDDVYTVDLWSSTKYADVLDHFDMADDDGIAFIYYPNGNTSGMPKETFTAIVASIEKADEKNSVTPVTVTLEVTGGVTEAIIT